MPAGFQAINDSGIVQIDADYKNFRFRQRGYSELPQAFGYGANVYDSPYTFADITAENPMVFWRTRNYQTGALWAEWIGCYVVRMGPTWFRIYFRGVSPQQNLGIDWWVFDTLPPAASSNGMQVFDGGGNLVFDANDLGMRLVDVFGHHISTTPTYSYGPQIAICNAGNSARTQYTNGPGSFRERAWSTGARSVGANDVQLGQAYIRSRTFSGNVSSPGIYDSPNWTLILVGNMDGL
jgi:hypothetical protein